MIVRSSIHIKADPEQVWDALVDPDKTKHYMFGCSVRSDFTIGGHIDWVADVDGVKRTMVHGHVQIFNPPHRFAYTVINPDSKQMDQIPENYTTVDIKLEEQENGTYVHVSQGDFAGVQDGSRRYEETIKGWRQALDGLRNLFE